MLGVLVMIALFNYDPNEKPETVSIYNVNNSLGIVGLYIAHILINFTIGYPVFYLPFFIIAWGFNRFFARDYRFLLKWTLYTALFATYVSVFVALASTMMTGSENIQNTFSGAIGRHLASVLILLFNTYGGFTVLLALTLITVISATEISFSKILLMAWDYIRDKIHGFTFQLIEAYERRRLQKHFQRQQSGHSLLELPESTPAFTMPTPGPNPEFADSETPEPATGPVVVHEAPTTEYKADAESTEAIARAPEPQKSEYVHPGVDILDLVPANNTEINESELLAQAKLLEEKLKDYGVSVRVVEISPGPVITRFEVEPAPGVKVSRITGLADDLALALRAKRIRIVAPIPGKGAVGIEIPNLSPSTVYLKEILDSDKFREAKSALTIAMGKTISGQVYTSDLATMPHLLIAGSTGSGKSVCINTIIASILYRAHPTEVHFVMIDPKRLELSIYSNLKEYHLTYPDGLDEVVATTPVNAVSILRSMEIEMERRYELLAARGVRHIDEYNRRVRDDWTRASDEEKADLERPLPYLVVIIDELADLMLVAAKEIEEPIARLAQMSRAVGIHLIVATQRPSVDVITGVIKANFACRIAFQVASKTDSRTILDMNGAEKLLGRGDMLFLPPGRSEPIRIHGAFISTDEIERIIMHIVKQPKFIKMTLPVYGEDRMSARDELRNGARDPLFIEAFRLVVRHQQGSVSLIQRRLKVGYSRAARLIDELEAAGVVGPFEGSKAREVLVEAENAEEYEKTLIV